MTNTDHTNPATMHTPEPWEHNDNGLIYGQCSEEDEEAPYVCDVIEVPALGMPSPVEEANARRIVATVNACQGIPTEALEEGVVRQLVDALEDLYDWLTPDWQQSNLGDKARAALAKATA
jgi:hypothetical protein